MVFREGLLLLDQRYTDKFEKLAADGRVNLERIGTVAQDGTHCKVLIVEDSVDDEQLMLRAIRKCQENIEVIVARDGQAAMEILQLESEQEISYPNVILSDLKLPLVDGEELVKSIRARTDGANATIIVFSSSDEDRDIERCRKAGANSFIQKPLEPGHFSQKKVCTVLSHRVEGVPLSVAGRKAIPEWVNRQG